MIPVLAVQDPERAKRQLRDVFGFTETAPDRVALGDQEIVVCDTSAVPKTLVALPLDHLALSVNDADETRDDLAARGAELDPAFTPDGPAEIPEFWANGVRFVFFKGPDGAPFEFCQKIGEAAGLGHSHYGLRTADLDGIEDRLTTRGATRVARHVLPGTPPVEVRFLALGERIYELFNDAPKDGTTLEGGWIGFIDDTA